MDAQYHITESCNFTSCAGCTNTNACNYDAAATIADGSCTYAATSYDCNNECIIDSDGDGVCDEYEILGCTNTEALNFNTYATDDDGSCIIQVGGCIIPYACNYDADADYYEEGSCVFPPCDE